MTSSVDSSVDADPRCCLATVVWGGAGDCRYFLDNERIILAETGARTKKLFVWDRWQDAMHVIGEYTPHETVPFSSRDLHPAWDRSGAYVAFDSTHSGQGWQVCLIRHHAGLRFA